MPRRKTPDAEVAAPETPAPAAPSTASASAMAQVLEMYTRLRDERTELSIQFKADDAKLVAKMEAIENKLHDVMRAQGVEQLKAGGRTAYITVTVKPRVDDWPAFEQFVLQQGDLSWLHRRPSEGVFKTYTEQYNACPPGTTAVTAREVRIRNN